jgi:chemotaxis regulatin CheY-phosphate phosphatase CheZ
MPVVNKKLTKVNEANETATIEILNVVDGLFSKIDKITKEYMLIVNDGKYIYQKIEKILEKIIVNSAPDLNKDNCRQDIDEILAEVKGRISVLNNIENIEATKLLRSFNDDMTSITMSLQVQDITSQQIAAVKHLLDTIRFKLSSILKRFNTPELQKIISDDSFNESGSTNGNTHPAFDPDAIDSMNNGSRQKIVDDLIEKKMTNEELDELLKSTHTKTEEAVLPIEEPYITEEPESLDTPVENNGTDESGSFSQDDIDALFGK